MRTTVPAAFEMYFDGADGRYGVKFQPTDPWDGYIAVSIGGHAMRWGVVDADREDEDGVVLGGMTTGSEALWKDQFWFELRLNDQPPVIRYWSDKVVWREDRAVDANGGQPTTFSVCDAKLTSFASGREWRKSGHFRDA